MEQVTIQSKRIEDGLIELSVLYDPSVVLMRTIKSAARSLTRMETSLFMSVNFKAADNGKWRFFAALNPNGTSETLLKNIGRFQDWAMKLTGAVCCIDMEGFQEKPARKRSLPAKKRQRKQRP